MYRLFAAAFLLAFGLLVTHAADDKKGAKEQTPSQMFEELKDKFRSEKDKQKRDALLPTYIAKFLAYAEKNKNEKGLEALLYISQIPGKDDKGTPKAQALAILDKDYAKTAKMGKLLKKLHGAPYNAGVRALLLDIAEHNKDKETRAYAYRALIRQSEHAAGWVERVKDNAEVREKMEKARGKEAVQRILAIAASSEQDIKAYKAKLDGDLKGVLPDPSVGKAAPEIITHDIDGKKVKLSDLEGKVVVLDFWATWCGPCKSMIPHTRELVKKMAGRPFVFVSISADEKKETLTKFLKGTPMPWTHWYSGRDGVVADWEIESFPTIYILDAKGVIRKKIESATESEALDKEVEKLVEQAESKQKK